MELETADHNSVRPHSRGGARTALGNVLYNRIVQVVVTVLVIAIVTGALFFFWQQTTTSIFDDATTLLTLRYPKTIDRVSLSDEDTKANIIFRAKESEKEAATPFLVNARYEEGLRKVSSMLRYDILDILTDNVDKLFPSQYPDFKKIEEKRYSLNNKRATEITFTYLSPARVEIMQRFVVLLRDEDMAVYVTAQAKKKDFEAVDKKYFQHIISSIGFQLK